MKKGLLTGLTLFVFALICGLLLATVNHFTSPVIKAQQEAKIKESLLKVMPELEDNAYSVDEINDYSSNKISKGYVIKKDSNIEAYIYIASGTGHEGEIQVMVCIDKDLTVKGLYVVSQKESIYPYSSDFTFGMIGATKDNFNASSIKETDFDYQAGASESPNAIYQAVSLAMAEAYKKLA